MIFDQHIFDKKTSTMVCLNFLTCKDGEFLERKPVKGTRVLESNHYEALRSGT